MNRATRGALGAVLTAVLLAVLLAGCTGDDDAGDPIAVGQVVEGVSPVAGQHLFVQTPDGRIDFTVTEPLEEFSVIGAPSGQAPEDGAVVGVSWEWDFRTAFAAMVPPRGQVEPRVRLVVDGREYPLDEVVQREDRRDDEPVLDFDGTAYVGVDGEPEELAVAVEFDGLDQVVEVGERSLVPEGPAAGLYLPPDALARYDVDCSARVTADRVLPADTRGACRLAVARVPYEPTVGWVSGHDDRWLQVQAWVSPLNVAPVDGRYCGPGELGDLRYRLAGDGPEKVTLADPEESLEPDRVVFASGNARPDELRITAVQTFVDGGCPPLRLTWTVQV